MPTFRSLLYLLYSISVLPASLYDVTVESSSRKTITGQTVGYELYYPNAVASSERRFPAVVLTHGFGRKPSFHKSNARYMAERGIVVMTPEMTSLRGTKGKDLNIANTVDHVRWLVERSRTSGDALFGLIDP